MRTPGYAEKNTASRYNGSDRPIRKMPSAANLLGHTSFLLEICPAGAETPAAAKE